MVFMDCRNYKRLSIVICLCMMLGLMSDMGRSYAGSAVKVRLVITNTNVTRKTYFLSNTKHRQLHVKLTNAFGKVKTKYSSDNANIASVTKNGYIAANSEGTTKIRVKVTCKSGKKKVSKKTWVQMNITPAEVTPEPAFTENPIYTPYVPESMTPVPTATQSIDTKGNALQAFLQVNGTAATTFAVSILDNEAGRALYNSLPKVLSMTDQNGESKIATDPSMIYKMDEYKPSNLVCGDLMLYGTNKYELSYRDHTTGYAYTRLGRVLNPAGLETALGGGGVSVTLVRGLLPTATPSATVAPTVRPTTPPWGTGTPWPSYSPGPGMTPTPPPSGAPTPTPAPTAYTGEVFNVLVGGFSIPFIVDKSSSAAVEFYNDLGSGTQTYEMIRHRAENRYYAALPKNYIERNKTSPPDQWAGGNLVLMGSNEISVITRTMSNSERRASTVIGTLDKSVLTSDSSVSQFMTTYFSGDTVTVQILRG